MGQRASPGRLSGEILGGLKSREIAGWFLWRKEMEFYAICGRVRFGLVFSFSADQTRTGAGRCNLAPFDGPCTAAMVTRVQSGSEYG